MRFFGLLLGFLMSFQAAAEEQPRTILVMDGSGSMWGQIDGVAKITIAQEVVGDLLRDIPLGPELGLTVYGHRRKGDCSDIETVVAPAPDTRDAIDAAVRAISPRGKTPMTDAVVAAAEALRYTEEKATVILVSDGIETCAPDPCAAARSLEAAGVDFTAHVVGFDVSDDATALAQMQCIAEETGGIFRTASNAAELGDALAVVAEPEQEFAVEMVATAGAGGPRITEGIVWTIGASPAGPWLVEADPSAVQLIDQLPAGRLFARVERAADGASAERSFTIDETTPDVLTLVLPELPPAPVRLIARAYLDGTGTQITEGLVWDLTTATGEAIIDAENSDAVRMELRPDVYTVSVVRIEDEATASQTVTLDGDTPQVIARLNLPEILRPVRLRYQARLAGSGKVIRRDLVWTVRDREGQIVHDHIGAGDQTELMPGRYSVRVQRTEDGAEISREFALTKSGKDLVLELPPLAALATLDVPKEAPVGSGFLVDWTGPNEKNDYVAIAHPEDKDNAYFNYEYTRQGPTLELTVPSEPGTYEVRYHMAQEGRVVARVPLIATPVTATLDADAEAPSGATIDVVWTGPNYANDYVVVAKKDDKADRYINYRYTRYGSPAGLEMPIEPGDYQLRYVMALDKVVLATRDITVTEESFDVTAPSEAIAGSTIAVDWIGPDLKNDFIAVAEVGAKSHEYVSYAYTRHGSPAEVVMPMAPGAYEIRYIVSQTKEAMANRPLTVLPVSGSITAADSVAAGDVINVTWAGPGYQKDYVAIAEVGSKVTKYLSYKYTRSGKVVEVQAPSKPGEYELRYVAHSKKHALLASQPLTVTDVSATVTGPEIATAGSAIEVGWTGPGYRRDYVAIFPKGEDKRYVSYSYTRSGETLSFTTPEEPGDYELRYVMGQDRRVLYAVPLIVK